MRIRNFSWAQWTWPLRYRRFKGDFSFTQEFTPIDATYDHQGDDQADINKLTGIKESFFKPMKNSTMVGWRYLNGAYEYFFYWHIDGKREWSRAPILVSAEPRTVVVTMGRQEVDRRNNIEFYVHFKDSTDVKRHTMETDDNILYLINTWFGGNRKPGKRILWDLKVR